PNNAKIIDGYVREMRAPGTLADRPNIRRGRLQPLVDADIAASVRLDPGRVDTDPGRVGNPPRGDEKIARVYLPVAARRVQCDDDLVARAALHGARLRIQQKFNAFRAQNALDLVGNVGVLVAHDASAAANYRHSAAEAA